MVFIVSQTETWGVSSNFQYLARGSKDYALGNRARNCIIAEYFNDTFDTVVTC